jgi:phosphoserine phosphatase
MAYKAIAFDLDGTLVTDRSSWWKLHRHFGTYEPSLKNMEDYEQGKIAYDEFMRRDIALWKPRPHVDTIKKILLQYHLTPHAKLITETLGRKGYHIAIITTGLDILANAVASELHIPHVMANVLILNKKGYLTGDVIFNVDLLKKEQAFNNLVLKIGVDKEQCVAVGDSRYDRGFLKNAGLGIAFNPDEVLRREAKFVINDLEELLKFI